MAIRLAIGATTRAIFSMVVGEAARLAAGGAVAGTLAAVVAGQSLEKLLFGIEPADPVVIGGAVAAMLAVVFAATAMPARRASHANPNVLLRVE
jgi:putative ABC transport system permease protein